jgi:hypothetical protein
VNPSSADITAFPQLSPAGRFTAEDQLAEALVTSYPGRRQISDLGRAAVVVWWPQAPGQVRAMPPARRSTSQENHQGQPLVHRFATLQGAAEPTPLTCTDEFSAHASSVLLLMHLLSRYGRSRSARGASAPSPIIFPPSRRGCAFIGRLPSPARGSLFNRHTPTVERHGNSIH